MERALSTSDLENCIVRFLKEQSMCVLATCSGNTPRASAVEFFPAGTTIYILTEGGRKIENIERNPHVSVAVYAPLTDWEAIRGLQMSGRAEIGRKGANIFEEGQEAYRERRQSREACIPDVMYVIKVTPTRVEYLDAPLSRQGFLIRQVLDY